MRARYSAVLGILGALLIPFIHLSVYLFSTMHPMPIVGKPSTPSLPNEMLLTLFISFASFTLLYFAFVRSRYRYAVERDAAASQLRRNMPETSVVLSCRLHHGAQHLRRSTRISLYVRRKRRESGEVVPCQFVCTAAGDSNGDHRSDQRAHPRRIRGSHRRIPRTIRSPRSPSAAELPKKAWCSSDCGRCCRRA